jgi:hypothetical protein
MTAARRKDLACSILLTAPMLAYASLGADPLHIGSGYLVAVPMATLVMGLLLRAPALFLTGTTAGALATLVIYLHILSRLAPSDGLAGLGHLFSLPGLLAGAGVSAWLLRYRVKAQLPWLVAGIGFLGVAAGFMASQVLLCNTLMYCGALSLWR